MAIRPLPKIMVAPNGARRSKADHPALPITIQEITASARHCFAAGAGGLHAHVRGTDGQHVLDEGLYRELITEIAIVVPRLAVQITTEAVGRYSPRQQRNIVYSVVPEMVSVALREMLSEDDPTEASRFYNWSAEADVAVQHILYSPEELTWLSDMISCGKIPDTDLQLLFVLGRNPEQRVSCPDELMIYLKALGVAGLKADWAVCAFGQPETSALKVALDQGGKARVGFENNLRNWDGSIAADNAERVKEIVDLL